VNVLTRRPKEWAQAIAVSTQGSSWEHKGDFTGPLHRVSDDPAEVVPGSEYVIVAAPANAHPDLLAKVAPHLDYGAKVGALFAQGGFDWAVKQAFGRERCVRWRAQQAFFVCDEFVYAR
jgi:opine dehydrogenase